MDVNTKNIELKEHLLGRQQEGNRGEKMNYPKKYMSITEVSEFSGLSRQMLKQYSRVADAPITKTPKGGKIYWNTEKLDGFLEKMKERVRA